MKISRLTPIILFFGIAIGAAAQSLWTPGFTGYLSGKSSLQVGDLVSVSIDTNTKLSYTSSNVSDRTITLEFSGSSGGNPLSFLPKGTSNEKSSLKGGEDISLSTTLVARVQQLDQGGHALIQGSRTLEVNGRQEMVTVSGWMDPAMMSEGRHVSFQDLADSKLVYSSTLMEKSPVLTQADINQVLSQVAPSGGSTAGGQGAVAPGGTATGAPPTTAAPGTTPSATGTATAAPGTTPSTAGPTTGITPGGAATPSASAGASTGGFALTDAKKRALLVDYLNKMLDLIFAKGSP